MSGVLIVDDDARFRKRLRSILTSRFASVVFREATNVKQAFQEVKSSRPAFIFMDIRLGDDNGLKLTKKIKQLNPEIIISILTSYDFPEYRKAAFKNGADFFFIKGSTTLREIAEVLKTTLAGKDNSEGDIC